MQNTSIIGRIAPTPSGFLHVGNAYNFLVTWREVVHRRHGKLGLRIDDADSSRSKDEYLKDIFDALEWLEISPDFGPKDVEDFKAHHSQAKKTESYRRFLKKFDSTFTCSCTRSSLKDKACECFHKKMDYVPGENCIKLKVENKELFSKLGHITLWRKEDIPAYQLTSLFDDIESEVNFIVRGEDLLDSTKAQFFLAESIGDTIFTKAHFIHHPLLKIDNEKISKSQTGKDSPHSLTYWRKNAKTKDELLKLFGFNSWDQFLDS